MTAEERVDALVTDAELRLDEMDYQLYDADGNHLYADAVVELVMESVPDAIKAAVEEEQRRLIPLVCVRCASGRTPIRDAPDRWWHSSVGPEESMSCGPCTAEHIHEALYQQEQESEPCRHAGEAG